MNSAQPLVSIVTPVYNGAAFLAECIESVIKQTFTNWEYIIVNNSSTDRTLEIAEKYSQHEPRIKIFSTERLLTAIENHNFAVNFISEQSAYCKILHADDWMFADCLERMVQVAASHPTIGVVGSYGLAGRRIRGDGLPYPSTFVPGREISRLTLLGKVYPFWSPSSTLLRSELVRNRTPLYKPTGLHADVDVMYEFLQKSDFGFVHQVLTYIREHDQSETSKSAKPLNTILWSNLDLLVRYGPIFLDGPEFKLRVRQYLGKYYRFLANCFFEGRDKEFWAYHRDGLKTVGYPLSFLRLSGSIAGATFCRTRATIKRILQRLGWKR